jgi:septal ring factor EnvC (AmiA/AmiB activator)
MTNPVVLVEEIEQLRHELANAKTHITLQASINHLLEQHIASQDTVIRAAREVVRCSSSGARCRDARCHERLEAAIRALDHASS